MIARQTLHKNAGGAVSSNCTWSFAFSASQGRTGRDWISHRFLPSKDTEGVALSFMEATMQTMAQASTGMNPEYSEQIFPSVGRTVPLLISTATTITSRNRVPMVQLRM